MSYKFVLVDIDKIVGTKEKLFQKMKKYNVFIILQTSENHFQSWFYFPQITGWDLYTKFAKYLSKLFNSDENSTKRFQVGRMVGYINQKKIEKSI